MQKLVPCHDYALLLWSTAWLRAACAAVVGAASTPVEGDGGFLCQARQYLHLESVFLEHLQCLVTRDLHPLKRLLLLDDLSDTQWSSRLFVDCQSLA